jgi:gliding motility-associated-like protein
LRIDGIDFYTNCTVQIFDRYNNLVFEVQGYDNENQVWRGNSNKGIGGDVLPEGTYFYVVNLGDGSKPVKGFVSLKRE